MDWTSVLNLINTQGFPIVMCLILAWYVKDQSDTNNKRNTAMQENHAKEMKEVSTTINNNTIALTKLCTLVERGEKD